MKVTNVKELKEMLKVLVVKGNYNGEDLTELDNSGYEVLNASEYSEAHEVSKMIMSLDIMKSDFTVFRSLNKIWEIIYMDSIVSVSNGE